MPALDGLDPREQAHLLTQELEGGEEHAPRSPLHRVVLVEQGELQQELAAIELRIELERSTERQRELLPHLSKRIQREASGHAVGQVFDRVAARDT